jgi:hypothetical protein
MSTRAQAIPAASAAAPAPAKAATLPLIVGLAGIAVAVTGFFVTDPKKVAASWLIACMFFLTITLGMLFLVMIHHIFDSGWSTVLRRQLEHGISAFTWLALLFLPLVLLSWFYKPDLLWKWMNPAFDLALTGNRALFYFALVVLALVLLALAWVLRRGEDVVPIPGTKRRGYLEDNAAADALELDDADMAALDVMLYSVEAVPAPTEVCQPAT